MRDLDGVANFVASTSHKRDVLAVGVGRIVRDSVQRRGAVEGRLSAVEKQDPPVALFVRALEVGKETV